MSCTTVQPWSPFQFGFFEGVFLGNERLPELNSAIDELAGQKGVPSEAIAIARILRHPARMQAVVGTTNPQRRKNIALAATVEMSCDAKLERTSLTRADLSGALLVLATLQHADLTHANPQNATPSLADLRFANLPGADRAGAQMTGMMLAGAVLDRAQLVGGDLRQSDLKHASLRAADLSHALLAVANLLAADLTDANLSHADLSSVNLVPRARRTKSPHSSTPWEQALMASTS